MIGREQLIPACAVQSLDREGAQNARKPQGIQMPTIQIRNPAAGAASESRDGPALVASQTRAEASGAGQTVAEQLDESRAIAARGMDCAEALHAKAGNIAARGAAAGRKAAEALESTADYLRQKDVNGSPETWDAPHDVVHLWGGSHGISSQARRRRNSGLRQPEVRHEYRCWRAPHERRTGNI